MKNRDSHADEWIAGFTLTFNLEKKSHDMEQIFNFLYHIEVGTSKQNTCTKNHPSSAAVYENIVITVRSIIRCRAWEINKLMAP